MFKINAVLKDYLHEIVTFGISILFMIKLQELSLQSENSNLQLKQSNLQLEKLTLQLDKLQATLANLEKQLVVTHTKGTALPLIVSPSNNSFEGTTPTPFFSDTELQIFYKIAFYTTALTLAGLGVYWGCGYVTSSITNSLLYKSYTDVSTAANTAINYVYKSTDVTSSSLPFLSTNIVSNTVANTSTTVYDWSTSLWNGYSNGSSIVKRGMLVSMRNNGAEVIQPITATEALSVQVELPPVSENGLNSVGSTALNTADSVKRIFLTPLEKDLSPPTNTGGFNLDDANLPMNLLEAIAQTPPPPYL